jgi:hypothetical protein
MDMFRSKILFLRDFKIDEKGLIPPTAEFRAGPVPAQAPPAQANRNRKGAPKGKAAAPVKQPPPLTPEAMSISVRRRARDRSLWDRYLTDPPAPRVGVPKPGGDATADEDTKSKFPFITLIETSLFPVPVIREGKWR